MKLRDSSYFSYLTSVRPDNFEERALEVFAYQAENNGVYQEFLKSLGRNYKKISTWQDIPFLPIEFFKSHRILTGSAPPSVIFESSRTSAQVPSRHYIRDKDLYKQVCLQIFEERYGSPENYHIFALLPSYLERNNASLVYMCQQLMEATHSPVSGFYLDQWETLFQHLSQEQGDGRKKILLGVTFALLDFAEFLPEKLDNLILIETGGMKGRKREMTRKEVHDRLSHNFGLASIHSEYGMTELISQAYALGSGYYTAPAWMRIAIREVHDPLHVEIREGSGAVNVVDLANKDSCAFLATQDLGRLYPDGRFEILGRMDHSDIRGCNLMIA